MFGQMESQILRNILCDEGDMDKDSLQGKSERYRFIIWLTLFIWVFASVLHLGTLVNCLMQFVMEHYISPYNDYLNKKNT